MMICRLNSTTATTILRPLYRTVCISQHSQLDVVEHQKTFDGWAALGPFTEAYIVLYQNRGFRGRKGLAGGKQRRMWEEENVHSQLHKLMTLFSSYQVHLLSMCDTILASEFCMSVNDNKSHC